MGRGEILGERSLFVSQRPQLLFELLGMSAELVDERRLICVLAHLFELLGELEDLGVPLGDGLLEAGDRLVDGFSHLLEAKEVLVLDADDLDGLRELVLVRLELRLEGCDALQKGVLLAPEDAHRLCEACKHASFFVHFDVLPSCLEVASLFDAHTRPGCHLFPLCDCLGRDDVDGRR